MIITKGDWISFYSNGSIVISEVVYVLTSNYTSKKRYATMKGVVNQEDVLEARSPVCDKAETTPYSAQYIYKDIQEDKGTCQTFTKSNDNNYKKGI